MPRHSSLFQFEHGDHTCLFYRSEESLMEVLIPYIAEGLRRGEHCFCVQKSHMCTRLLYDLRFLGFDTDDLVARGALDVRSEDEVYVPNGRFDPRAMMDMVMRSLNEALDRGFPALRGAGDLSWAVKGRNECELLLEYEGIVNGYHPGRPLTGLCQYDANAFSPRMLDSVVRAHGLCVSDLLPSSPNYSGVSTHSENFCSDIVADKLAPFPAYYYVVQRGRPYEVVSWGTAPSYNRAHAKVKQIVRHAEN